MLLKKTFYKNKIDILKKSIEIIYLKNPLLDPFTPEN